MCGNKNTKACYSRFLGEIKGDFQDINFFKVNSFSAMILAMNVSVQPEPSGQNLTN